MAKWWRGGFKEELYYFLHSLDWVVTKLKKSEVQQQGWEGVEEGRVFYKMWGRCEGVEGVGEGVGSAE